MKREKKAPSAPASIVIPPSSSTQPSTEDDVPPLDASVVEPASNVKFSVAEVSRSRKMLADNSLSVTVIRPIFS